MKETRTIKTPVKVEKRGDGTIKSIVGYPIIYNKDSEDMGFIERIAPGAATKALKASDVRGLKNHDASLIFARSGVNLTLVEDKTGVKMEATPVDTHNFRETAKEVDLGLLDGQSFSFNILADEWKDLESDKPQRTITEFGLIYDVGPVTFPAYPDTTVGLRTLEEARKDVIPETRITIIEGDTEHVFPGENRFDDAAEKIRAIANPTIPAAANTEPDPTIIEGSVLDRINSTLERYKK
mgnify:CR=1 FL=1